jgi:O-antigen/teichoic acid export membrane protein
MAEDTTVRKPTSKSAAVVFQGASKLVGLVIQFFFYRYCVLWLGETGFGTFQFAVSCAAFLGLADLGMPAATQRFLGEAMAKDDLVRVATIFRFVRLLHASLAGAAIILFGAFALVYDSSMRTHASDPHALILFLCGLQTAGIIVMSPALTIAYAFSRFKEVAWINFVQVTLTPLLGIVMLYNYRTPEMLATTTLVGGVVSDANSSG